MHLVLDRRDVFILQSSRLVKPHSFSLGAFDALRRVLKTPLPRARAPVARCDYASRHDHRSGAAAGAPPTLGPISTNRLTLFLIFQRRADCPLWISLGLFYCHHYHRASPSAPRTPQADGVCTLATQSIPSPAATPSSARWRAIPLTARPTASSRYPLAQAASSESPPGTPLCLHQAQPLILALKLTFELQKQRRAIPQGQRFQTLKKIAIRFQAQPLRDYQTTDPITMPGPLFLQDLSV
jgi:hypothetical protein